MRALKKKQGMTFPLNLQWSDHLEIWPYINIHNHNQSKRRSNPFFSLMNREKQSIKAFSIEVAYVIDIDVCVHEVL